MASKFSLRGCAKAGCQVAALVIMGAVGLGSAAFGGPIEAALVESSNSPSIEFMEYVQTGQVIQLGPNETIVLTYMSSCVRERITGGTVIIGLNQSDVRSGEVAILRVPCGSGQMELTAAITPVGVRIVRGLPN